jgi:hypothetical protein
MTRTTTMGSILTGAMSNAEISRAQVHQVNIGISII